MRRSPVVLACVFAAAMAAWGCDNGPDSTPTTPTAPQVTETFTGTVTLNGSITHSFSATSAGAVVATITSISPSTGVVGFQLGTWNTVTCSAVVTNDLATQASVLQGTTQSSASLCVKLHDPNGALADAPVTYTVTVSHF